MKNANSPFKTEKKRGEALNKPIAAAIAAALILVLAGSVLVILTKNDFDLRSALSGEVMTSAEEEKTSEQPDIPASNKYYLLYCTDDESGDMTLLWIVKVRLPQRTFNFYAPSVQTVASRSGENVSFNYICRTRGHDELVDAVEKEYGIKISKSMYCKASGFKAMINYFGGITFSVPEKVEYREEFNLFLIEGVNTMKGDVLYKYLLWLGFGQGENISVRSDVLAEIFRTVLTGSNAAKTDAIYSKLANSVTTDFTIVDYRSEIDTVNYIFENGMAKVNVCLSESELTGKK